MVLGRGRRRQREEFFLKRKFIAISIFFFFNCHISTVKYAVNLEENLHHILWLCDFATSVRDSFF